MLESNHERRMTFGKRLGDVNHVAFVKSVVSETKAINSKVKKLKYFKITQDEYQSVCPRRKS